MAQRGRKSTAALAVVTTLPAPAPRLGIPTHLPATAQQAWREIVASRPADFFDDSAGPQLETLAVATAEHRRLSALLGTMDPLHDLAAMAKVARMVDMHALRIGSVSTKLRLTNQSRFDSQRAATAAKGHGSSIDRARANYTRGAA